MLYPTVYSFAAIITTLCLVNSKALALSETKSPPPPASPRQPSAQPHLGTLAAASRPFLGAKYSLARAPRWRGPAPSLFRETKNPAAPRPRQPSPDP